jgi:CheY-like chemotaxis protein
MSVPQSPRILVVDDEAVHRDTLAALLGAEGMHVTCCERARGALQLLQNGEPFDLIISDVVMPGMDGIEFADKARELRPDARVILVTGHDSAMDHVIAGGSIALLKPYTADALKRVLDDMLGRAS